MRSATLLLLILACALTASAADSSGGIIRITAMYPGADARTVDETVVSPLFRQVNGVEGMTRIESEARNDGTATLTVYFNSKSDLFRSKTDLDLAEMRVRDRVNMALPRIPEPCRRTGISVRKLPAGPPTFLLALTSSDLAHDETFLMNYANIYLKNEFARVPGVADVRVIGLGETAFRVFVNPDRMRAYKLGAGDLIDALRKNAEVSAGGSIGTKERRYTVMTSGRLTKLEQFENVVLRANPEGEVLRLKDVAKVEFSATTSGFARVNGKPAALIAVSAWPGRVSADKFYKAEALAELPPGMSFDVVADRSADRFLTVDVLMPYLPIERIEKAVAQATDSISALPGKPNTVAFAEGREPTATTILIKTPANGGPTVADVQKALADIPDLASRIDVAPPGRDAFPIRIALMDPRELLDASEPNQLRFNEVLDRVVTGLLKDNSIDHSMILYSPDIPKYAIDVDRDKCAMRGVQLDELSSTLQMVLEGVHATDFHKYGQAWKVIVQAAPQYTRFKEDLENLFVRNDRGDMVPLVAVVKIRRAQSPAEVFRVNGYRAAIITAAPAGGKTPAEAAARCVKLAQEILPKGYRVMDLTGQ